MRITQTELAKRLGVAQRTVSVALGGKGRISEKTKQRILEEAERLGYRRNAAARAQRLQRFEAIALLTRRRIGTPHFQVTKAVSRALTRRNFTMTYALVEDADAKKKATESPRLLRELSVDGIIVDFSHGIGEDLAEAAHRMQVPLVWMNTKLEYDAVYMDDFQGSRMLAETMLEYGHRRIVYLDRIEDHKEGANTHYSTEARYNGYLHAMSDAGCEPIFLSHPTPKEERDIQAQIERWRAAIMKQNDATAWILPSGRHATTFIAAASSLGLTIPNDLSLGGIEWTPQLQGFKDLISMAVHPINDMGEAAVDMLLRKIKNPKKDVPSVNVPYGPVDPISIAAPRE